MRDYDGVDGEWSHGSRVFRQLVWMLGKLSKLSAVGEVIHSGR